MIIRQNATARAWRKEQNRMSSLSEAFKHASPLSNLPQNPHFWYSRDAHRRRLPSTALAHRLQTGNRPSPATAASQKAQEFSQAGRGDSSEGDPGNENFLVFFGLLPPQALLPSCQHPAPVSSSASASKSLAGLVRHQRVHSLNFWLTGQEWTRPLVSKSALATKDGDPGEEKAGGAGLRCRGWGFPRRAHLQPVNLPTLPPCSCSLSKIRVRYLTLMLLWWPAQRTSKS